MNLDLPLLLAQDNDAAGALGGLCGMACGLIMALALPAFMFWKVFEKAGKPGWASIVPIYNVIVLLEIAEMPLWWLALVLIPCVNIIGGPIFAIILGLEIAKRFGQSQAFGIGLALLGIIFYPILGFGDARYQRLGPGGQPVMGGYQPPGPGYPPQGFGPPGGPVFPQPGPGFPQQGPPGYPPPGFPPGNPPPKA